MTPHKELIKTAWLLGIKAVNGQHLVQKTLKQEQLQPTKILAIGKAAGAMTQGALAERPNINTLIITKQGHTPNDLSPGPTITIIEAGHPIPDAASLRAGKAAFDFVANTTEQDTFLLLLSGGASALAEQLQPNLTLEELKYTTQEMIASGKDINAINQHRQTLSTLKGGQLLTHFKGKQVAVYAISDVPSNEIATIGSGIGDPSQLPNNVQRTAKIIANNQDARDAAATFFQKAAIPVQFNEETLHKNLDQAAREIAERLKSGPNGAYIWGGEPTLTLPETPGIGGRNQSLALATALNIYEMRQSGALKRNKTLSLIAAGTDGTDGPTPHAGTIIDDQTITSKERAREALTSANATPYFAGKHALFDTGPTGTNVMDVVIALKSNF